MTTMTKAQMQELLDQQAAQIEKLMALANANAKTSKPKDDRPDWISKPADYATAEQLAAYNKLVAKAIKTRDAIAKAAGTESVKAFIPISKKSQAAMPHTISWSVSYSK